MLNKNQKRPCYGRHHPCSGFTGGSEGDRKTGRTLTPGDNYRKKTGSVLSLSQWSFLPLSRGTFCSYMILLGEELHMKKRTFLEKYLLCTKWTVQGFSPYRKHNNGRSVDHFTTPFQVQEAKSWWGLLWLPMTCCQKHKPEETWQGHIMLRTGGGRWLAH